MNATHLPRPKCIPRTSETELHLMGNMLERYKDKAFYATEKLDGFSFSFGVVDGEFIASARDRHVVPGENTVFGDYLRSFNRSNLPAGFIFQGELVGPGIRGNRYGLDSVQFYAFDVIKDGSRIDYIEARAIAEAAGLAWVPVIAVGFNVGIHASCGLCDSFYRGASKIGKVDREGIVCRTMIETADEYQGRVSFKVFNPDYPFHH